MRKILTSLLLMFFLFMGRNVCCQADEISESELYARSACLMDADSGRVLFEKEAETQLPMASTTKIMTCILALEQGNAQDLVTVSARAAGQPRVHMGAEEGEQFLLGDLLYALMLNSDNDAAGDDRRACGRQCGGFCGKNESEGGGNWLHGHAFCDPQRAGRGGRVRSTQHHCPGPGADSAVLYHGIASEGSVSGDYPTPSYTFWNNGHTKMYNCTNANAFLGMMDGALTGKTGFTADAGYCYVGALQWEGKTFIVSLLACGWPSNKG